MHGHIAAELEGPERPQSLILPSISHFDSVALLPFIDDVLPE
jgi:hypothetical protein